MMRQAAESGVRGGRVSFVSSVLRLLAGALLGLAALPVCAQTEPQLTAAERAWLAEHPAIRVSTKTEWAPIDLYTYEGQFRGLSGDYLGLIAKRLGIVFEFTPAATLADSLDALKAGRADLLPSVARTPARERHMEFSQPYLDVPNVYVARRGVEGVGPQSSMAGLRIAAEKGYGVLLILRERHPLATVVEVDDSAAALRAVSEGGADAYLGALPTTSFLVEKLLLTNLEVRSPSHHSQSALHFGVRKEDWALRNIIDKTLATITLAERQEIHRRWVPLHSLLATPSPALALSDPERRLVATMPALRVGYEVDYRPYSFRDGNGELAGMAGDYLKLLAERTGLPVGTPRGGSWTEVYGQARRGEIDLLVAVAANEERAKEFIFVGPWLSTPNVLVTRRDALPVLSLGQYAGRTLAVLKDGQTAFLLRKQQPRIEQLPVDTRDDLLAAVVNGQADAAFVNASFAAQRLSQGMGSALKMAGFFPELNSDLYLGVRRDQPQLAALLKRALANVNESEHAAIAARWAALPAPDDDPGAGLRGLLVRLLPLLAVLLAALLVSLWWAMRLRREVRLRRAAQEALREARDRAEALARARHDFLAEASHEIRTPVNAVLGALGQLALPALPQREQELARLARQAAQTLSEYVNNLLDLSMSDAGALHLVLQPDSLSQVLREALQAVEPAAQVKGLSLALQIDPRLAARHQIDAFRLHQIVLNLLSNAVRFSAEGQVRVEARVLETQGLQQRVALSVCDQGSGIEPERVKTLFRAYAQAGDSVNHRNGGSGLGLALCKRLVDAMGGSIALVPAEEGGTLATVTLPLAIAPPPPALVEPDPPAGRPPALVDAPLRVLLVEDDPVQQLVLETTLSRAGCVVDVAASAEQAQEAWRVQHHPLVVADLQLRGMSGWEFARWLRAQPDGLAVHLVGTSADLGNAEQARAAGIARLLQKPVAPAMIEQIVRQVRGSLVAGVVQPVD